MQIKHKMFHGWVLETKETAKPREIGCFDVDIYRRNPGAEIKEIQGWNQKFMLMLTYIEDILGLKLKKNLDDIKEIPGWS